MRAAFVLLLVMARAASADTDFVWEAPATCPDGENVRARIEHRLGAPLEIHGVEVAVTRTGKAFVASVDTRGVTVANQVRTLTSARCDELADAVAVVVARLASEWRRVEVAARPPADREEPFPTTSAAVTVPTGRTFGLGVHVMALSGIGTVPRVGVGGEFSVFVRRKDYFAEVGFARWASQSAYLVNGAPGRVEVGLDVATVRVGWSPVRMPVRTWLGGELGAMNGQGASLANAMRGTAPWVAITGGLGIGWPMTRYARLVGTFEIAVPTTRVRFELAQSGDIYSSSPAAARCALGLELGLP